MVVSPAGYATSLAATLAPKNHGAVERGEGPCAGVAARRERAAAALGA